MMLRMERCGMADLLLVGGLVGCLAAGVRRVAALASDASDEGANLP